MEAFPAPPKDKYCPQWRRKMSAVCPTCIKWIKLRGTCANTGREVDGFQCADVAQFMGTLAVSDQVRQAGIATESMRNVVAKAVTANMTIAETQFKLIEGKK